MCEGRRGAVGVAAVKEEAIMVMGREGVMGEGDGNCWRGEGGGGGGVKREGRGAVWPWVWVPVIRKGGGRQEERKEEKEEEGKRCRKGKEEEGCYIVE